MKYTVTGKSVLITGGVLILSDAQAKDRVHALKPTSKKGEYNVLKPVEFKAGEVFDYDGELPKSAVIELNGNNPTQPGKKKSSGKADQKRAPRKPAAKKSEAAKATPSALGNEGGST